MAKTTQIVRLAAVFVLAWSLWNLPMLMSLGRAYSTKGTGTAPATEMPTRSTGEKQTQSGNYLEYPRLGIRADMGSVASALPTRVSDWNAIKRQLRQGVSLTYATASFEQAPRAFITGHSSDTYPHRYSSVFAPLGMAQAGDRFTVRYNGQSYTYEVVRRDIVSPYDTAYFERTRTSGIGGGAQQLDLVTCWPLFTTKNRLVIVSQRVP